MEHKTIVDGIAWPLAIWAREEEVFSYLRRSLLLIRSHGDDARRTSCIQHAPRVNECTRRATSKGDIVAHRRAASRRPNFGAKLNACIPSAFATQQRPLVSVSAARYPRSPSPRVAVPKLRITLRSSLVIRTTFHDDRSRAHLRCQRRNRVCRNAGKIAQVSREF